MGIFSEVGKILIDESSAKTVHDSKPKQPVFETDDMAPPPEGEVISDGEDTLPVVVINRIVSQKTSINQQESAPTPTNDVDEEASNFWNAPPKIFEMPPEIRDAKIIPRESTQSKKVDSDTPTLKETQTTKEEVVVPIISSKEKEKPLPTQEKMAIKATDPVPGSPATIVGDVHFPNDATVSADINGNVSAKGTLTFHGTINGKVDAEDLVLCGIINGALKCKSLTLLPLDGFQMSCIKGSVSTEALYMKTN